MRRRSLLAAFAGAGTWFLPGCSAGSDEPPRTATTSEASTSTEPPTAETQSQATPRPGDVPRDRVVTGEAVSDDDLGVTADRWFGLERLRYREQGTDERRTVTTERGWFVAYEFTIGNVGESQAASLPDSVFTLRVDGETYEHVHEFPGGVHFSALDQPETQPQIRDLAWYDGLAPGESVSLQLVFEAPVRLDYRHYLAWDHRAPVEGAPGPVFLAGRRVLPGA